MSDISAVNVTHAKDTKAFLVHVESQFLEKKIHTHSRKKHKLRESNRFCFTKKKSHIDLTKTKNKMGTGAHT